MSDQWEAVRLSSGGWNVYLGEDTAGVVFRIGNEWFATAYRPGREQRQRTGRQTARQAAYDMWGPEAAEALA